MTDDAKLIKEQLERALKEQPPDASLIISLAHALGRKDESKVRFSIDASHVSRLGFELVAKQETAVSELIKNAYDADATRVDVTFKNVEAPGGSLEVVDNGHGMTRDQLIDGFMRISTRQKVDSPVSPNYGRQRAGRKGIGRFAAQRLGRHLTLLTQRPGAESSLRIELDWDRFSAGMELYEISASIEEQPPLPSPGTTLRIDKLRDAWSVHQVKRAYRYVSELLQPFPLSKVLDRPVGGAADPGFKVGFYRETNSDIQEIVNEETSILSLAIAKLEAGVNGDGNAQLSVASEKYQINLKECPLLPAQKIIERMDGRLQSFHKIAGVRLVAHYFIADELATANRSMAREVLKRSGGIRIYRNGFRVLPYGAQFDDWLGLQRSSALREILPPHHNTNFAGFVEIRDVDGLSFEETSSREGLVENEAFEQLKDFVFLALMDVVIKIANARGKKVFSSDKPVKSAGVSGQETETPAERAARIADALRQAGAAGADRGSTATGDPTARGPDFEKLAVDVEALGRDAASALAEAGMLRVLASLGLTIGEFTHEVRHALSALHAMVSDTAEGALGVGEEITNHIALLRSYMRYFDDAVANNAHRILETHEIRDVVNEFVDVIRPSIERQRINLSKTFDGYDLFTCPMHRSEWSSILLNLFTNSMKAIHRVNVPGRILIEGGGDEKNVYIRFSDNGDGIPVENRDRIFEAFFTTSAPPGPMAGEHQQLMGAGLGLKIVQDIVHAVDGYIEVVDPPSGYSTCIEVVVPRAKEEVVDEKG